MGYTVQRTIYALAWGEDTPHPGMEVRVRSAGVGVYRRLAAFASTALAHPLTVEQLQMLDDAHGLLGELLVAWNLEEEDGTPIPATADGLRGLEASLVADILLEWMRAVAGVPAPLVRPSTDGDRSVEASLTMEPLSTSPPS